MASTLGVGQVNQNLDHFREIGCTEGPVVVPECVFGEVFFDRRVAINRRGVKESRLETVRLGGVATRVAASRW